MSALAGLLFGVAVVAFVAHALARDVSGELGDLLEDDELDEIDEGPLDTFCRRCGDDVDPDTGACERCLTRIVRRAEGDEARLSQMPEPDEVEEQEVARLQAFLDAPHNEAATYCPACLGEHADTAKACHACSKPVLPLADVLDHVERSVADITSDWFLPVLDDREGELFYAVLEEIEVDETEPPLDIRVRKAYASWNGLTMTERLARHVPVLFLRRRELPRLRELVLAAELPDFGELARRKLLQRLDRLSRGRSLR